MYKTFFLFLLSVGGALFLINAQAYSYKLDSYKSKVIIVESWTEFSQGGIPFDNPDMLRATNSDMLKSYVSKEHFRQIDTWTREVLSGQIYGYTFSYTPSDAKRKVEGVWKLEKNDTIRNQDDKLFLISVSADEGKLFGVYRYNLDDYQIQYVKAWETVQILPSMGVGYAVIKNDMVQSKIISMEDAIRDAVRTRLRLHVNNKPKEVKGIVRLSILPVVLSSGGTTYTTKVMVDIKINTVKDYQLF